MTDLGIELADAFGRMVATNCDRSVVRAIEKGGDPALLWQAIDDSGFLDALVPEATGGFGLVPADAVPLLELAGRHLLPVPFAETLMARALLARAGGECPTGALLLARGIADESGVRTATATFGRTAAHALVRADGAYLLPIDQGRIEPVGTAYDRAARLAWRRAAADQGRLSATLAIDEAGAAAIAALIAGALGALLEMTVGYATERRQFGRPIGQFQAVQQQISILAEHVTAATLAVRAAFGGPDLPGGLSVAIAKFTASEAVRIGVPIAHAVFAAIGISEEHDLHLFTRRLNLWRMEFGAETRWAEFVGEARLEFPASTTSLILGMNTASG